MAFCKKCDQQVKDANVKKFHLYEYRSKFEFNCCYCSDCYEQLLDLGYIICNHCGNSTNCIGLYGNLCTAIESDDSGNSKTVYVCCPVAESSNNLLATGLIMTILSKAFQVSHLGHWIKETIGSLFNKNVSGHTKGKSISQFQALCTALAATIGVGNIAGVVAAITTGGPGAVFWMWVAAFLGMMTNYSENALGIFYRRKNSDGEWSGGAMYYLQDGLGSKRGCKGIGKFLAVIFSIFCILASFGIGNMGQVNKIVV